MNAIRTAAAVSVGLIVALWWAVMPPRDETKAAPGIASTKQQQCPKGSLLRGKYCVCPPGKSLNGGACT
jgi:hypothetical protein